MWACARRRSRPPRKSREGKMANTPDYSWPPIGQRKVIGQRVKRLDGPVKATGRAKYASDTKAGANAKQSGEQKGGDVDQAFQQAEAVSEGHYGFPVITHCCLESHGQVIQWQGENAGAW